MRVRVVAVRFLLTLAVIALLLPAFAAAQVTFVQANNNAVPTNPSSLATVSVPYAQAQTAGNLNVVVIGWSDASSAITGVSDNNGNTYVLAVGTTAGSNVSQAIYYAKNINAAAAGANTVTVTFSQAANSPDVRILEYSGADQSLPLDANNSGSGSGTSAATAAATTTSANDLIFGGGTTATSFTAPGSGFTQETLPHPQFGDIVEDKAVSSAGSNTATATNSSGSWVLQMAAFRATGQSPSAAPVPTLTSLNPTSGFAGVSSVSLVGTGFQQGDVVLFGSSPAVNCAVISPTEIDCRAPGSAGLGAVNVVVQNVDGVASSSQQFTYVPFNPPTVSNINPNTGTTNGGNQVTITGTNFNSGATVHVQQNGGPKLPASNVSVTPPNTITANMPAGMSGAADVIITNPDGSKLNDTGAYTYTLGTAGINFVQIGANASGSTLQSVPVTMPVSQTAGNLNVVIIGWNDATSTITKVEDSAGNTYTAALPITASSGLSQTIYYAKLTKGGANTVTVTFSGAVFAPDVRVLEYSGLDAASPLDNATGASGSSTLANSGAVVTTHAFDVLIGAATVKNAVADAGQGYTTVTITANGDNAEQQIVSTAGSYSATAPIPQGGSWVMQMAAFKASTVAPPAGDFTLSTSGAQTVTAGSSAQYTITVTPQNGFSSAVNLGVTCPANVQITCSISPKSVTPGGAATTATLTVTTTAATASLYLPQSKQLLPLYAIFLPLPGIALVGAGWAGSRRRKLGIGASVVLLFLLLLLLLGCGGGGSSNGGGGGGGNPGTPAGSYNITVTATSGSLTHTASASLTVQ